MQPIPIYERHITVFGSTSVGKSALTIRFVNNKFTGDYDPTIAKTYYHELTTNTGIAYKLKVLDTAGLEQQSTIPTQYLDSHGFILVYSIADYHSFDVLKDIYNQLQNELGSSKPLVLIGNKSDLSDQRHVSYNEGKKLADQWNAKFLETSAKKDEKVKDVFVTLLSTIDPIVNNTNNNTNQQNTNNNNNQINNNTNISNSGNHASLRLNNLPTRSSDLKHRQSKDDNSRCSIC